LVSNCTLACAGACNTPVNFQLCQRTYLHETVGNFVEGLWLNTTPYENVDVFLDGALLETVAGNSQGYAFENLTPGVHTFGIQGICADATRSDLVEKQFTVVDASPHTNVVGEVFCEFLDDDPATAEVDPTTVATFSTLGRDESVFIDVFLSNETIGLGFVGRLFTDSAVDFTVNVRGTEPTDRIELQFFSDSPDDLCYGSELVVCQFAGNLFVRGVCNGIGTVPNISTPIFGLNWLFASGEVPPCLAACKANGDGSVNIADMVFILNFLFGSGAAPPGWDGINPVCELEQVENCLMANPLCPL